MATTPKKRADKGRKDDVVRMRVTTNQKRALENAANRAGLELSAWLRQLALRAAGALPET
jgi:uncharacterized protein (DUF1778 family)